MMLIFLFFVIAGEVSGLHNGTLAGIGLASSTTNVDKETFYSPKRKYVSYLL